MGINPWIVFVGADDGFVVSLFALPVGVLTFVELFPLVLLDIIDCGFVGFLLAEDAPSTWKDDASSMGGDAGRLRPTTNDCRGNGTRFRPRYCVWGLLLANNADAVMRMEEDIIVFNSMTTSSIIMSDSLRAVGGGASKMFERAQVDAAPPTPPKKTASVWHWHDPAFRSFPIITTNTNPIPQQQKHHVRTAKAPQRHPR